MHADLGLPPERLTLREDKPKWASTARGRSNEEIFAQNLARSGRLLVRVMVQIYDPENGRYAGLRGQSFVFEAKRPATVYQVLEGFRDSIRNWGRPDSIINRLPRVA
jgi:hypothetical protein